MGRTLGSPFQGNYCHHLAHFERAVDHVVALSRIPCQFADGKILRFYVVVEPRTEVEIFRYCVAFRVQGFVLALTP